MPRMGIGMPLVATATEAAVLTIDDFVWDIVSSSNLNPLDTSGTLNDTSNIWDYDGTNIMPEADPDSEGVWERGPNLVTNHDFAVDANWTKGTGWSISGGTASCDGSQSANSTLVQQQGVLGVTLDIQVGNAYELIFTLTRSAGGITNTEVGGTTEGTTISSSGTHSKIITASSTNDRITFTATPDFVGSIDNVTLKEYAITPLDV